MHERDVWPMKCAFKTTTLEYQKKVCTFCIKLHTIGFCLNNHLSPSTLSSRQRAPSVSALTSFSLQEGLFSLQRYSTHPKKVLISKILMNSYGKHLHRRSWEECFVSQDGSEKSTWQERHSCLVSVQALQVSGYQSFQPNSPLKYLYWEHDQIFLVLSLGAQIK